jgi:formamidopyrimidine-DNA glycosylase
MSELPAVEVVRRELVKLQGGRIVHLASRDARVFARHTDVVLSGNLPEHPGRRVRRPQRRGPPRGQLAAREA